MCIYLGKDDSLELFFLVKKELIDDIIFALDV